MIKLPDKCVQIFRNIIISVLTFTVIIGVVAFDKHYKDRADNYKSYDLTQECIVKVNDKKVFSGDASRYNIKYINKNGNKINLEFKMQETDLENAIMVYSCRNVTTKVKIDGELIHSHGNYTGEADIEGCYYTKIPVKKEYAGKDVNVELVICDKNSITALPEILLMNALDYDKSFISRNMSNIFITIGMLVIPIIGIACIVIGLGVNKDNKVIVWLLGLSISASMWTVTCFDITDIIMDRYVVKFYIEHLGLFLILEFAILFMKERYRKDNKNLKFLNVLLAITTVYIVATTVLQLLKKVCYTDYIGIYFTLVVLAICVFVKMEVVEKGGFMYANKVFVLLFCAFFFIAFLFVVQFIFKGVATDNLLTYVPITVCVFTFACVSVYIYEYINTFVSDVEAGYLMNLAYYDSLTMIANRRACEQKMEEIDADREKTYGLFLFDVNKLKYVNDTYGHVCGDELLIRFSKALREVFEKENDFFGRLGGDEFIAVIDETNDEKKTVRLDLLRKMVKVLNEESDREYELFFSAGYYERKPNEQIGSWEALAKADKLMYEEKHGRVKQ